MTVKDNVVSLWKELRPDIRSIAELERRIDLSNGIISQWDKSTPTTKSAQKVADFFNVPLSRVLDDVRDSSMQLGEDEQQIVTLFRKHTDDMTEDEKRRYTASFEDLLKVARDLSKKNS